MKIALALLLAASVYAADTFEVKELKPETIRSLAVAEAKLETSVKVLAEAQKVAEQAKAERDGITAKIKADNGAYVGECVTAKQPGSGNVVYAVVVIPNRQSRTVEIRGKYALVTETTEQCGWDTLTGSNVVKSNGTDSVASWRIDNGPGFDPPVAGTSPTIDLDPLLVKKNLKPIYGPCATDGCAAEGTGHTVLPHTMDVKLTDDRCAKPGVCVMAGTSPPTSPDIKSIDNLCASNGVCTSAGLVRPVPVETDCPTGGNCSPTVKNPDPTLTEGMMHSIPAEGTSPLSPSRGHFVMFYNTEGELQFKTSEGVQFSLHDIYTCGRVNKTSPMCAEVRRLFGERK